ncbi:histidine kinase dimerization/phospho-acceptor domain-containing protein, partial [Salmonella enterica]|uniref:histidine kinase dimerization/phospho-acceptor domain-containing protein n=1 Tax=Salmonella enterica TaxID=28901 RepID=UPI003FA6C73C
TELQSIADNTNHLLQRLASALDTERAMAADAAHELRTPLATTRLRLQGLLAHPLPEVSRQELRQALEALERLSRRTEKLLQLSRAESGAALTHGPVN